MPRKPRAARAPRPFFQPIEPLERRQHLDGRPIATLEAAPVTLWGSTYVFRVAYTDDVAINPATIDGGDLTITGPNNFNRPARFWRSTTSNAGRTVHAYYKISAPGSVWDAADNGTYTVDLNPYQVRDTTGNSLRSGTLGTFAVAVPQYPTTIGMGMPIKGVIGVDVRDFGAVPNDGVDDTAAIQAAIDSLPMDGDGVPDPANALGGNVILPAGTFNTSRPLRLPAGTQLRGEGPGSVLANSSGNPDDAAIELVSLSTHGFNIRAGVVNLKITTAAAKGIETGPLGGDLIGLRLNDLTISAGGVAIDLRAERTYQLDIRNVTVQDPGSTALWVGRPGDWSSAVNRITGFNVLGTARPGFRAERAMVVIGNDATVEGLHVADTGAPVTSLWVTGVASFTGTSLWATRNVPGGVIAMFEKCSIINMDRLSISAGRKVQVADSFDLNVKNLYLADGSRLVDSVIVDGTSHLTADTLRVVAEPGPLEHPRVTVRQVGAPNGGIQPLLPLYTEPKRPVGQAVVDVRDFGAIPYDALDDTAAIQRAIDALPRGSGIPGVGETTGGLVLFPSGEFRTNAPLQLPSGVWLRGHGNGTSIVNTHAGADRGVVEFVSRHAHGYNVGAGVEDLGLHSTYGLGVRADQSITNGLVDLRIANTMVSGRGRSLDFSSARTYHMTVENVMVANPGSTAIWLGDAGGYSADNRVIGLQLQGTARNGFTPEKALVVLGGQETLYHSGWLEQPAPTVMPLSVSGSATIKGLWLEYPASALPTGVNVQFENTTRVDVDRVLMLDPGRRMNLVNAKGVRVEMLNLDASTAPLRDVVAVDGNSRLSVGIVNTHLDSGMLDHPRVHIQANYNQRDRAMVQNRSPVGLENLVVDPNFLSFGRNGKDHTQPGDPQFFDGWRVTWGDQGGAVQGRVDVEQTAAGPRLKVTITSNPNQRGISLHAKLRVSSAVVGRHAIAKWRIDGITGGQPLVYNYAYGNQFSARATNTMTSARTPVPIRDGEQLTFLFPAATGVFYLSAVGVFLT
jgi:hypothetical protein